MAITTSFLSISICRKWIYGLLLLHITFVGSSQLPLWSPHHHHQRQRRLLVQGGASSSSASYTQQTRRWERMDGRDHLGHNSNNSLQSSLMQVASANRACGVYLWDAPSALLHRWCHHLLKDCVYEGMGGRKFVRIEPGSILQLLYPCSRYSLDRCILCGGSFHNHLTLWWAPHLYTPLDQTLDKTYQAASVLEPKYPDLLLTKKNRKRQSSRSRTSTSRSSQATRRRSMTTAQRRANRTSRRRNQQRRQPSSSPKSLAEETMQVFAFHRAYVRDIDSFFPNDKYFNMKDPLERRKKLSKELSKLQKAEGPLELRVLPGKKKAYLVPAAKGKTGFLRFLCMNAVDRLIVLQETENERLREQQQQSGNNQVCCP